MIFDRKFLQSDKRSSQKDKMLGCLYGQAIGYALGLGTEFMSKDDVKNNFEEKVLQVRK